MGQGLPVPAPGMVPWSNLLTLPAWTGDETPAALAQDWYLDGLSDPAPVQIPWTWIAGPLRFRQDKAITYAAVTKSGGATSTASVAADEQIDFTATLDTVNDVDAENLAHFAITYYDAPRTRCPQLRLILNSRAATEIWTILGLRIGDRVQITGVPTGWPDGADHLVIEGIRHSSRGDLRVVEFSTSPVIGEAVGEVGPFFRVGVSALGGTDLLPW